MKPIRRTTGRSAALALGLLVTATVVSDAHATDVPRPSQEPAETVTGTSDDLNLPLATDDTDDSYTAPATDTSALSLRGYVDVGFARAQGDGTSFAPADTRLPADYGVDTFAPAVNTRGDVASTDTNGRFVNGFLPSSVGIGNKPSFLLNVLSADARYEPKGGPVTVFSRLQMLPRFFDGRDQSRVLLEQAFGRVQPLRSQELTITIGKFDSVFGIEYLENQSNFRTGITPSLFARYTTGTSLGGKAFYRLQAPRLWSAFSLNVAGTNSGNFVESLQESSRSLTGTPVGSARLGYELYLPYVGIKLGASGLYGPRNDQTDARATQRMYGFDGRVYVFGLALSGEYVRVDEGLGGDGGKATELGTFPLASGFHARGFYTTASYGLALGWGPLRKVTVYGRYEQRHASFTGFSPITVNRITGGLRVDMWEFLILKAEALHNGELSGAPVVRNDVLTSSAVFAW